MTAKQIPGNNAPDGSTYITLTDGNGNLVTPGGGAGITVGTTVISGGTTNRLLYDNGGVIGEAIVGANLTLSAGTLSASGGGGTPGGANTDVQFNNAGAFGGDAGFTYAGQGNNNQVTIAQGTLTAAATGLEITATWNNGAVTFNPLLELNFTNTAAANGNIFQVKVGGSVKSSYDRFGNFNCQTVTLSSTGVNVSGGGGGYSVAAQPTMDRDNSTGDLWLRSTAGVHFYANNNITDIVGLTATNAQAFRVYNTSDVTPTSSYTPTNYERGVFDWTTTSNTLTIGTQAGGTGTLRGVTALGTWTFPSTGIQLGSATSQITSPGTLATAIGGSGVGFCTIGLNYIGGRGVTCRSDGFYGFTSNAGDSSGATFDTAMVRHAAGVFGFHNANTLTSAAAIQVYNTSDVGAGGAPTNYERFAVDWTQTANRCVIGSFAGGTGTARTLAIGSFNNGQTSTADYGIVLRDGVQNSFYCGGNISFVTGSNYTYTANFAFLGANQDAGWYRVAANVLGVCTTTTSSPTGWLQWAGEARLDADFSATSNTALANVTGTSNNLSVSLIAGRKYIFDICLLMVTGASAGGIKIGIGGTATVTNLIADGWALDGTTNIAVTRVAASPGTLVANTNAGTAPVARFMGTFECLAAGTFTIQFAQNASSGTASTVKRGSYMKVHDAP